MRMLYSAIIDTSTEGGANSSTDAIPVVVPSQSQLRPAYGLLETGVDEVNFSAILSGDVLQANKCRVQVVAVDQATDAHLVCKVQESEDGFDWSDLASINGFDKTNALDVSASGFIRVVVTTAGSSSEQARAYILLSRTP